jgi:AraC-like DNA-binding protein
MFHITVLPFAYCAGNTPKMTVADRIALPATRHFRQSVAAGMVLGLIDHAASRGADRRYLLANAGLPLVEDIDPNRRVPLELYARVAREAKRLCNNPALAIEHAAAHGFDNLSIVGLIAYASATIRDAIEQLNRFGRLVTDISVVGPERFTISYESDGIWLTDNRLDQPPFPECTETTFIWLISAARDPGDAPYCSLAEVTHEDPGTRAAFEHALGAPIRFGASRNALRVSKAWLDYRINQYPCYAFSVFCAHADSLLAELDASRSVAGQVERLILPMLHTGKVTAEEVARQLNMSGQGLYRTLRAEGTTFEELLAELRHRFAKGYLIERRASLKEIAYLLGYSDVSAFSRAFKRREGISPGAFMREATEDFLHLGEA